MFGYVDRWNYIYRHAYVYVAVHARHWHAALSRPHVLRAFSKFVSLNGAYRHRNKHSENRFCNVFSKRKYDINETLRIRVFRIPRKAEWIVNAGGVETTTDKRPCATLSYSACHMVIHKHSPKSWETRGQKEGSERENLGFLPSLFSRAAVREALKRLNRTVQSSCLPCKHLNGP